MVVNIMEKETKKQKQTNKNRAYGSERVSS